MYTLKFDKRCSYSPRVLSVWPECFARLTPHICQKPDLHPTWPQTISHILHRGLTVPCPPCKAPPTFQVPCIPLVFPIPSLPPPLYSRCHISPLITPPPRLSTEIYPTLTAHSLVWYFWINSSFPLQHIPWTSLPFFADFCSNILTAFNTLQHHGHLQSSKALLSFSAG